MQLYIVAGDSKRAEQLEASRRTGATRQEEERQKKFSDEQAELEKELDL